MSMEKMAAQGRLGQDAELRFLSSGKAVLTFSVAIDPAGPDSANQPTVWRKVTVWGEKAEELAAAGALTKGAEVYAEGFPRLNEWTGKDGQHHAQLEITAYLVQPIAAFRRNSKPPVAGGEAGRNQPDDGIPF